MTATRRLWCVCASLAVCGGLAIAQSDEPLTVTVSPAEEPVSWLDAIWNLPVFRWLAGLEPAPVAPPPVVAAAPPPPPCAVEPLPGIDDSDALAFEASAGDGPVVNLDGLTPPTSRALSRFERLVVRSGGSMILTSAFRPAAYQEHLRAVWFKWMYELRENQDPACSSLKAQVGDEFSRHQLLPSQHPVPVSDHTLGIGFDAAVQFPLLRRAARRRHVSLDRLARLSGVQRPDIRHDPVHFRLIGGRV